MNILAVLDHSVFRDSYLEIAKKIAPRTAIIWYRIKDVDAVEIYNRAKLLRDELPNSYLSLSEHSDIAAILKFDAVHLGSRSMPCEAVKKTFENLDIGYSSHSLSEVISTPADYYTLSPIFETKKPYPHKAIGAVNNDSGGKVFALGGVKLSDYEYLTSVKKYCGIAGITLINEFLV